MLFNGVLCEDSDSPDFKKRPCGASSRTSSGASSCAASGAASGASSGAASTRYSNKSRLRSAMQVLSNKDETVRVQDNSLRVAEARIAALTDRNENLQTQLRITAQELRRLRMRQAAEQKARAELVEAGVHSHQQELANQKKIVNTLQSNLSVIEELYRNCFYESAKQEEMIESLRQSCLDVRLEERDKSAQIDRLKAVVDTQKWSLERCQDIAAEVEGLKSEIMSFLNNTNNDSGMWEDCSQEGSSREVADDLQQITALLLQLQETLICNCECGLREENKQLKEIISSLQVEQCEPLQKPRNLESSNMACNKDCGSSRDEKEDRLGSESEKENEAVGAKSQIHAIERICDETEDDNKSVDCKDLREAVLGLEDMVKDVYGGQRRERSEARRSSAVAEAKLSKCEKLLEEMRREHSLQENSIKLLKQRLQQATEITKKCQRENASLKEMCERIGELENTICEKDRELEECARACKKQISEQVNSLRCIIAEKNRELEECKKKLVEQKNQCECDCTDLKNRIRSLKSLIATKAQEKSETTETSHQEVNTDNTDNTCGAEHERLLDKIRELESINAQKEAERLNRQQSATQFKGDSCSPENVRLMERIRELEDIIAQRDTTDSTQQQTDASCSPENVLLMERIRELENTIAEKEKASSEQQKKDESCGAERERLMNRICELENQIAQQDKSHSIQQSKDDTDDQCCCLEARIKELEEQVAERDRQLSQCQEQLGTRNRSPSVTGILKKPSCSSQNDSLMEKVRELENVIALKDQLQREQLTNMQHKSDISHSDDSTQYEECCDCREDKIRVLEEKLAEKDRQLAQCQPQPNSKKKRKSSDSGSRKGETHQSNASSMESIYCHCDLESLQKRIRLLEDKLAGRDSEKPEKKSQDKKKPKEVKKKSSSKEMKKQPSKQEMKKQSSKQDVKKQSSKQDVKKQSLKQDVKKQSSKQSVSNSCKEHPNCRCDSGKCASLYGSSRSSSNSHSDSSDKPKGKNKGGKKGGNSSPTVNEQKKGKGKTKDKRNSKTKNRFFSFERARCDAVEDAEDKFEDQITKNRSKKEISTQGTLTQCGYILLTAVTRKDQTSQYEIEFVENELEMYQEKLEPSENSSIICASKPVDCPCPEEEDDSDEQEDEECKNKIRELEDIIANKDCIIATKEDIIAKKDQELNELKSRMSAGTGSASQLTKSHSFLAHQINDPQHAAQREICRCKRTPSLAHQINDPQHAAQRDPCSCKRTPRGSKNNIIQVLIANKDRELNETKLKMDVSAGSTLQIYKASSVSHKSNDPHPAARSIPGRPCRIKSLTSGDSESETTDNEYTLLKDYEQQSGHMSDNLLPARRRCCCSCRTKSSTLKDSKIHELEESTDKEPSTNRYSKLYELEETTDIKPSSSRNSKNHELKETTDKEDTYLKDYEKQSQLASKQGSGHMSNDPEPAAWRLPCKSCRIESLTSRDSKIHELEKTTDKVPSSSGNSKIHELEVTTEKEDTHLKDYKEQSHLATKERSGLMANHCQCDLTSLQKVGTCKCENEAFGDRILEQENIIAKKDQELNELKLKMSAATGSSSNLKKSRSSLSNKAVKCQCDLTSLQKVGTCKCENEAFIDRIREQENIIAKKDQELNELKLKMSAATGSSTNLKKSDSSLSNKAVQCQCDLTSLQKVGTCKCENEAFIDRIREQENIIAKKDQELNELKLKMSAATGSSTNLKKSRSSLSNKCKCNLNSDKDLQSKEYGEIPFSEAVQCQCDLTSLQKVGTCKCENEAFGDRIREQENIIAKKDQELNELKLKMSAATGSSSNLKKSRSSLSNKVVACQCNEESIDDTYLQKLSTLENRIRELQETIVEKDRQLNEYREQPPTRYDQVVACQCNEESIDDTYLQKLSTLENRIRELQETIVEKDRQLNEYREQPPTRYDQDVEVLKDKIRMLEEIIAEKDRQLNNQKLRNNQPNDSLPSEIRCKCVTGSSTHEAGRSELSFLKDNKSRGPDSRTKKKKCLCGSQLSKRGETKIFKDNTAGERGETFNKKPHDVGPPTNNNCQCKFNAVKDNKIRELEEIIIQKNHLLDECKEQLDVKHDKQFKNNEGYGSGPVAMLSRYMPSLSKPSNKCKCMWELTQLQGRVRSLEACIVEKERLLNECWEQMGHREKEVQSVQLNTTQTVLEADGQRENEILKQKICECFTQINDLTEQVDKFKDENKILQNKVCECAGHNEVLKDQVQDLEVQMSEKERKISELLEKKEDQALYCECETDSLIEKVCFCENKSMSDKDCQCDSKTWKDSRIHDSERVIVKKETELNEIKYHFRDKPGLGDEDLRKVSAPIFRPSVIKPECKCSESVGTGAPKCALRDRILKLEAAVAAKEKQLQNTVTTLEGEAKTCRRYDNECGTLLIMLEKTDKILEEKVTELVKEQEKTRMQESTIAYLKDSLERANEIMRKCPGLQKGIAGDNQLCERDTQTRGASVGAGAGAGAARFNEQRRSSQLAYSDLEKAYRSSVALSSRLEGEVSAAAAAGAALCAESRRVLRAVRRWTSRARDIHREQLETIEEQENMINSLQQRLEDFEALQTQGKRTEGLDDFGASQAQGRRNEGLVDFVALQARQRRDGRDDCAESCLNTINTGYSREKTVTLESPEHLFHSLQMRLEETAKLYSPKLQHQRLRNRRAVPEVASSSGLNAGEGQSDEQKQDSEIASCSCAPVPPRRRNKMRGVPLRRRALPHGSHVGHGSHCGHGSGSSRDVLRTRLLSDDADSINRVYSPTDDLLSRVERLQEAFHSGRRRWSRPHHSLRPR